MRNIRVSGMRSYVVLLLVGACSAVVLAKVLPPKPYGATPTAAQLQWHKMEFYGFLHFTVNTFTNKEWGYGDEDPSVFNPTDFSAEQIVSTAAKAGMKGLILTCKHHDGFCLWPSRYTEHSVKNSIWKQGKGDVVRAISDACRRHGLKFGVYLSPWDRNHADYGKPAYVQYYRNQLRELLTQYGPIFELWWDGANGGSGYYGGARETRHIDRGTYYGWDETRKIVRKLQPNCIIFSDAGDIRWIGNERGIAGEPCWATYTPHAKKGESKPGPGTTKYREGNQGHRNGKYWMPGECDVSIRPGWFYHPEQDNKVRSPQNLLELYYVSVGRGASLLLNLPPDRRGRIPDNDVASLLGFRRILDETFAVNLAVGAKLTPSNIRGNDDIYNPTYNITDGNRDTYWACDDGVKAAELLVECKKPITFNVVDIREYLPLGQRIDNWSLAAWKDGKWQEFGRGQSIGPRRLWHSKYITTEKVRLQVKGPVCPAISEFGLYAEPADAHSNK